MESSQLNVLTRFSQHLVRKALMLLVGLNLCMNTPVAGQCGNDFTTCRPTNASCGNPTLTLLSAALGTPGECVRCPDRGTISLPMTLTIQNTGTAQTAVAIWAVVTKTNSSGSTTCRMARCSDMPLVANGISTVSLGNIQYSCGDGDQLTLTNIVLTSTATGTCADLQSCNTPCSRTTGSIVVTLPRFMTATLTATTPSCVGAADGSITVAATGGTPPYNFTIAPGGTTNTTGVFTGLSARTYRITVVDAAGCRDVVSGIVVAPKTLTITCPPTDGGTFACEADVPAPNHALIGLSGNAQGCNITITSADVRNNGTGCANSPLIITRTYTIAYGVTTTNCVQTFTIIDNVPPVVTASSIANCYSTSALAEAAAIAATNATDNCSGTVRKTATTVGDCAATITVTGTDACGNSNSVSYQTRIDNTPPTAVNTDLGMLPTCNELLPTNTESLIRVTDNCPGRVSVSTPSDWTLVGAADANCIGTYTRTYIVTDECNNSATISQTVQRKDDRTPPVFTTADLTKTLSCDEYKALAADFGSLKPTATDGCPGAVSVVYSSNDQTQLCATGSFTITWIATDACGNSSTGVQTVTVTGYTNAPVLTQGTIAACYPTAALAEAAAIAATNVSASCAGVRSTTASTIGTCSAIITVTVTDACGRSTSVSYPTRIDNTPPTPDNVDLGTLGGCNRPLPLGNIITATDNCDGNVTIRRVSAWALVGSIENCVATYQRVFDVSDICGNTIRVIQTIRRIEDVIPPVVGNLDLGLLDGCNRPAPVGNIITATDNCDNNVRIARVTGWAVAAQEADCIVRYERTFTATDNCGNVTTATQTVRVKEDLTPPTFAIADMTQTISCDQYKALTVNFNRLRPSATDGCPGTVVVRYISNDQTQLCATGSFTITWRAIDACGNRIDGVQTIHVTGYANAPVLTAGTIAACYPTAALAEAAAIAATTVQESCSGNSHATASTDGTCSAIIVVTVTDACGHTASVRYQTRIDNTPPTLTQSNLGLLDGCNPALPIAITATDNCSGDVTITQVTAWTASNTTNCIVTYTRTCVATDGCGNAATLTQTVQRKEDVTAPVFTNADLTKTLTCAEYKALAADFSSLKPTATDGCPGAVSVVYSSNDQTQLCTTGSFTITWTATDACGNSVTGVQTVTVTGYANAPVLTAGTIAACYPTAALAEAAAIAATTVQESCSGNNHATASTDGTCSTIIVVTVTDACGHTASVRYQTRIDNTPPTLTQSNLGLLDGCNPALPIAITATDNCSGDVTVTQVTAWTASSTTDCIGTYTRTCVATDGCGNSATLTQTVQRKEDQVPPVFTNADLTKTLTCAEYKALAADLGSLKPTATDGCPGAVSVVYSSNNQTQLCTTGSFTITWTATDACGNSATGVQTVTVTGYANAPVLTAGTIAACYPTAALAEAAALAATTVQNNCVGVVRTTVSTVGTCAAVVTVTVTDGCGRRVSVAYNTRIDNTPPIVANTDLGTLPGCNRPLPTGNIITATDNCNEVTITMLSTWAVANTTNCVVTYIRTFVAKDACGNTTHAAQMIKRVEDNVAPVFQTADLIKTLTCAEYQALAGNYESLKPLITDNCPGAITVTYRVNANAPTTICNRRSFTIHWLAVDACGNRATGDQTVHINTPTLAVTATVSCSLGGGTITINAAGGCGPYSYVVTCLTGGATPTSSNNVLTNVANGTYTVVVTDANGCTDSKNVRVNCAGFCTLTQAEIGNNSRPNCPAVDALMTTPIVVGSGSRTLTLNTKECVVSLLPSTGTAAGLSASATCSSCTACTNCECTNCGFPVNPTITANRLLGNTVALALSLRKSENINLGALHLSEICGLDIPTIPNVSGATTVSGLLGILNQALGCHSVYSSHLGALATLTHNILLAYNNCANPCAKNPCAVLPGRDLSETAPAQLNIVKEKLDFKVYPVPSSGTVQVALEDDLTQDITITVYTLTSQVVQIQEVTALNQKSVTLELGHLPDGTYLISVRGASQMPVSKVLIINK
jgi:SprB repeat/Secretion system C-terminal sorting domain